MQIFYILIFDSTEKIGTFFILLFLKHAPIKENGHAYVLYMALIGLKSKSVYLPFSCSLPGLNLENGFLLYSVKNVIMETYNTD